MAQPKMGREVIVGENAQFGEDVIIWNYVVIGSNTKIRDRTRIGSFCDIGKDVVIGRDCMVQAQVTISNKCQLGHNVFIGPNSSLLNDRFPHSKCLTPSIVRNNVIVGGCVTILPNVTIGEDSVIAAGSIVTKDVWPQTVVKGAPARTMMTRKEYESKMKEFIAARKA